MSDDDMYWPDKYPWSRRPAPRTPARAPVVDQGHPDAWLTSSASSLPSSSASPRPCLRASTAAHLSKDRAGTPHSGLSGLGILTRLELWPEAMRRVARLKAHPRAQERFLDAWCRVPMCSTVRRWVGDDDLFFSRLRVLLPVLRRAGDRALPPAAGARTRRRVVVTTLAIARKFALYGCENVDPHNLSSAPWPPREGAAILTAPEHRARSSALHACLAKRKANTSSTRGGGISEAWRRIRAIRVAAARPRSADARSDSAAFCGSRRRSQP
jgi:hypothetical protein